MARPRSTQNHFTNPTFSITTPDVGDLAVGDHLNTIFVKVHNLDSVGNTSFTATITEIGSGSFTGTPGSLRQEGTSDFWSGRIYAGNLPSSPPLNNNKVVSVRGSDAGEPAQNHEFRAYSGGSGSSAGSIGDQSGCDNCSGDMPVPVLLQLIGRDADIQNLDCSSCTVLNEDVFLQHSDDQNSNCSWFSDLANLIPCCETSSAGTFSGFWELKKSGAHLWELRLLLTDQSTSPFEAALYVKTTNAGECLFPIELVRLSETTNACQNWPETLTVAPADI